MDMNIIIPTRGRTGRQITARHLSRSLLLARHTTIVAPERELDRLRRNKDVAPTVALVAQPDPDMTITKKRQWIMETFTDRPKMVMLDDDLDFLYRREDCPPDAPRLKVAHYDPPVMEKWFQALADQLSEEVPHAGFGPRMQNHTRPTGWIGPNRMMFALGYFLPVVLNKVELGRIGTREDFDVCLQLLVQGYTNKVTHEFVVAPREYGQAGGCSTERTTESSNADARKLADLFPGYVSVIQKDYKGHPRLEVQCKWQAALQAGAQRRELEFAGP